MTMEKKNSNYKNNQRITIADILDERTDDHEIRLYRDILRFFEPYLEQKFLNIENDNDRARQIDRFKIRELVNWLLDNNDDLKMEFSDSKVNKAYRAHKITPRIRYRIEKLVELELLVLIDKVTSERNRELTELYGITRNGILIASTLYYSELPKGSEDYKKILKFLLEKWLSFLPKPYKDLFNYYYSYLKDILEECVEKYYDIPQNFINMINEYPHGFSINFSDLRSKINYIFYKRMMNDIEFKSFFYHLINNHDFFKGSGFEPSNLIEGAEKKILEIQKKVKFQFKLDVESQIEREFFYYLRFNPSDDELIRWNKKNNIKCVLPKELSQDVIEEIISKEMVLNFQIKSQWEGLRNSNLSKFNVITTLVRCHHCYQIYSLSLKIEKESLNDMACQYCNNITIKFYDFEYEMNQLWGDRYLKKY